LKVPGKNREQLQFEKCDSKERYPQCFRRRARKPRKENELGCAQEMEECAEIENKARNLVAGA
jgi:hypothetical protein